MLLPLAVESTLPVQLLRGVYLGLLTGILPALVALSLGFVFRYVTGVSIPAFGVVGLAVAVAGANGGLLALVDPAITSSADAPVLMTAVLVVMMLAFYAHNRGDRLGAELPRRLSLRSLRGRSLASDVVERAGGFGRVRVTVVGTVADVEGYPPLPEDVRAAIRAGDWTFPADLPMAELEGRLADRLRTEFELAEVAVTIDDRAQATVAAAPPLSGLSRRVPAGKRAVSVDALLPTGLARGDEVTVLTGEEAIAGTVVSARSDGQQAPPESAATEAAESDEAEDDVNDQVAAAPAATPAAPTTAGGEGRLTVAVGPSAAETLVGVDRGRVVVAARGSGREYELVSLLRRAGQHVERLTVRAGGPLDGVTLGEAGVRDAHGVVVLAARHDGRWRVGPRGGTRLAAGDEVYAAGPRESIAGFREAVA